MEPADVDGRAVVATPVVGVGVRALRRASDRVAAHALRSAAEVLIREVSVTSRPAG